MQGMENKDSVKKHRKIRFEGEDNDEEVLYVFRRAVITNVGWLFSSFALLIAPAAFNPLLSEFRAEYPAMITAAHFVIINIFWYIFTFGFIFERFLNWYFNVHIITTKRVVDMDFDHLLHRNISEAPLRNIEDVTYTVSGTFQTLFNFGTVSVQTAAEKRELEFINVENPAKIQDMLSDMVSQARRTYGD